jgi:hypothetical protein
MIREAIDIVFIGGAASAAVLVFRAGLSAGGAMSGDLPTNIKAGGST